MSRQQSGKWGIMSSAKKEDSARDLMREENLPKGAPVGGAFGSRRSAMSNGEDDLYPEDKQHRGTHTTYEPGRKDRK